MALYKSVYYCCYYYQPIYQIWSLYLYLGGGGAMGRTLDLQSNPTGGKSWVTTLGKLFTFMCLCHQAV